MPPPQESNGWDEYRRFVVAQLASNERATERVEERLGYLDQRLGQMDRTIASLQVKSSVWGGLAGVITVLAALLLKML